MVEKKKRKRNCKTLPQRVSDMLDIPLEGITYRCSITICGDEEVSAFGCAGVLSYEPQKVVFRTVDGIMQINGDLLQICSLIDDQITVRGKINSIYLHDTGERKTC